MTLSSTSNTLSITPLGAGNEVGRSCIIVKFCGKTIMLDCGIHPAYTGIAALPYLDWIDLETVDVCLVTHFHLDHAAAIPYLMEKTNFKGRVYMTHPTKAIYKWLLADYVRVSESESSSLSSDNQTCLYTENDLTNSFERIIALDYHQIVELEGITFNALNAGHVLGAAMFMIEIAGVRILYTGDYSREDDRHLMAAEIPIERPDVIICESTFGVHTLQPRMEREMMFARTVTNIVRRGGRCLIPMFALGTAQELLLILDEWWNNHPELSKIPIYYASPLAKRCISVYQTYVNMMNLRIRKQITMGNPFHFKHIVFIKGSDSFSDTGPCVMLASPGMLQSGLSRELFERWCGNPINGLVIAGYVVEGTLGKFLLTEPNEFEAQSGETLAIRCTIDTAHFSAHVDYSQNSDFLDKINAKHVILVHGEQSEMTRLKTALLHRPNHPQTMQIYTPKNCETIDLTFRSERLIKIVGSLATQLREEERKGKGLIKEEDEKESKENELNENNKEIVSGILIAKDFEYQLLNAKDLSKYFPHLKPSKVIQRQIVKCRVPLSLVEINLQGLFGKKSIGRMGDEILTINDEFTLTRVKNPNDGKLMNFLILEWNGDPIRDMFADSIMSLVIASEGSRVSAMAAGLCSHSSMSMSSNVSSNFSFSNHQEEMKEEYKGEKDRECKQDQDEKIKENNNSSFKNQLNNQNEIMIENNENYRETMSSLRGTILRFLDGYLGVPIDDRNDMVSWSDGTILDTLTMKFTTIQSREINVNSNLNNNDKRGNVESVNIENDIDKDNYQRNLQRELDNLVELLNYQCSII